MLSAPGRPRTVDKSQPCSTEGCGRFVAYGNGLCNACYQRYQRTGSTEKARPAGRIFVPCEGEDCDRAALYVESRLCARCYQRRRHEEARRASEMFRSEVSQSSAAGRVNEALKNAAFKRYWMLGIKEDQGFDYYFQYRDHFEHYQELPEYAPDEEKLRYASALAQVTAEQQEAEEND